MSLRTPNPLTSYQTMLDLQRTKEQMSVLGEQLASGNRLVRLGDDPTASALVLDFQDSINRNNAYVQQANSATSFLQTTETSLQSVSDSITRLLEIGQQGLSDTMNASGRTAIAQEVDGIKSNLLSVSNTQAEGKFIFAGTKTTTQPFASSATGATYSGDNNSISLDVALSTSVDTNIPGDNVFYGGNAAVPTPTTGPGSTGDLFTQVTALRDALNSNNTAQIQTAYTNLQAIQARVNNQITDVGGRQSSLNQLTTNIQNYNLSLQTIQGSYQDLDYPSAITQYTKAQTSQQASLSVLAKSNNQNLFNYLG